LWQAGVRAFFLLTLVRGEFDVTPSASRFATFCVTV
jgi:hypothetical protein